MLDVFKLMLAAPSNFNFYEECATAVPQLRCFLKENVRVLPREIVARCELKLSYVQYERRWTLSSGVDKTVDEWAFDLWFQEKTYSVRRDPATLRRYAVEKAVLNFGNNFDRPIGSPVKPCYRPAFSTRQSVNVPTFGRTIIVRPNAIVPMTRYYCGGSLHQTGALYPWLALVNRIDVPFNYFFAPFRCASPFHRSSDG